MIRRIALALLVLAFGGCRTTTSNWCAIDSLRPAIDDQIYFKLRSPRGDVTQDQWESFVDRFVGPHLRNDFRLDASGVWPSDMRGPTKEPAHFLHIRHLSNSANSAAVEQIISAYETEFAEHDVLRITLDSCTTLE